jgi:hypothetical protein
MMIKVNEKTLQRVYIGSVLSCFDAGDEWIRKIIKASTNVKEVGWLFCVELV